MTTEKPRTAYVVGRDNIKLLGMDVHHPVFVVSVVIILLFVGYTLSLQSQAEAFFHGLLERAVGGFDWFLISAANCFFLFSLFLAFSPLGRVRLGGQDATPDFSYPAWLSMLFSAGMGIGLMFYGVSEPMDHFTAAYQGVEMDDTGARTDWAPLAGAEGQAVEARNLALAATFFHWGFHPWSIYALVGMALAFFAYNYKLPLTMRSVFYPLLGERVWGWPGHVIDILAVFATLFALATSLGLGTEQALAGIEFLYGWESGGWSVAALVTFITLIAIVSVTRGLANGIKRVAQANMALAAMLLLVVLFAGPTGEILRAAAGGLSAYAGEMISLSTPFGREDVEFSQQWTGLYWAWWVSEAPFVGMFIARVSRGRTVREFVMCVMIIPAILCMIWMTVFGAAAIDQVVANPASAVAGAKHEIMLFEMLREFPFTQLLSFVGIVLVLVFFITTSDSGSLVIDTITAGGKVDTTPAQRVVWCSFEGIIAILLLLVGGTEAIKALQSMTVAVGLPFTLVMLLLCYSIWRGLHNESRALRAAAG